MAAAGAALRSWFTNQLHAFWAARFRAFLDDSDPTAITALEP